MRILMISPQPFFQPRGTPFSVYFRARTLAAMGHKIDILTYPIGRDVAVPGVRVLRCRAVPFIKQIKIGPSFPKFCLDVSLLMKGFWQLLTNRYDYVHAHEEGMFFCLFYRLFFRRMRVIYDMHSSLPQQLSNFNVKFARNKFLVGIFRRLEALSLKKAAGIITICPALQKTVDAMNLSVPSVMIENTLFDHVDFADAGDDVGENLIDWARFEGKKVVFYSGTFETYQGLAMLIDSIPTVVAHRPDALFLLVGGARDQVRAMRALVDEKGVRDFVVFTGNLPPNAIKAFIRRADVLVSPRIKGTNSPLKIYEYLASGKPIVATRHPTHTQIVTDREAVLTDCDARGFADGILEVLDNPDRAAAVAQGAFELHRSAYAPRFYRERLELLFQRMSGAPVPVVEAEVVGAR